MRGSKESGDIPLSPSIARNRSDVKVTREEHTFAFKLHFPCSNNEAQYEALVMGLKAAKRLGIKNLKVFRDSKLVMKQIEGPYGVKNPSLATYRATT